MEDRLLKLKKIRDLGVEPYPHNFKPTHLSNEALKLQEGDTSSIVIAGRLMRRRVMGKAAFFHIQDAKGQLQCYIQLKQKSAATTQPASTADSTDIEARAQLFKLLDIGDLIGLQGQMFKTQKGELTLRVQTLSLLCKSLRPLPEKYHGLQDTQLKYRHRHLDLIMNPETRRVFRLRSKILQEVRRFLDARGFLEVDVPILQPIYGGAAAQPFTTHHRRLDLPLYLKISPELYLKRLIAGGFDKVYDMSKNFRNEGLDRSHNPEFMMLEWYEAYTDYHDQMQQFEQLVSSVAQNTTGSMKIMYQDQEIDLTPPWRRLPVGEALKQQGLDVVQLSRTELFERVKQLMQQNQDEKIRAQADKLDPQLSWGALVMQAFELLVEATLIQPTFVVDFPLEVSPLTKHLRSPDQNLQAQSSHTQNSHAQGSQAQGAQNQSSQAQVSLSQKSQVSDSSTVPQQTRWVERFEPIVAGFELGNAYTELNDPIEQRARLEAQDRLLKAGSHEAHPMDEDFMHAVEVGLPPTGGVGLGIERLVMLLTNQHSIRDVLFFPTTKPSKSL